MDTKFSLGQELRTAAEAGDLQGVEDALAKGADVDSVSLATGWTALHHAVDGLHYNIVETLLSAGSNIDAQDARGQTPLHVAAYRDDSKIIELLVRANASQSLLDMSNRTAFTVAYEERNEAALAGFNSTTGTSSRGMIFGHTKTGLTTMPGVGEDSRVLRGIAEGEEELREAAVDGDVVGVEEALRVYPGINIEAIGPQGLTALFMSVSEGRTEVVKALLKHGAKVDVVGPLDQQTPVHVAAANGNVELVEILVASDPSVIDNRDIDGQTPILLAAEKGYANVVRILLEFDADCSIVDKNGRLPLFVASVLDQYDVVEALLNAPKTALSELQIDRANRSGETALHGAAAQGNVEVAKLLIQNGANIEAVDKLGATPLLSATDHTQFRMVYLLISLGADPNAVSSTWQTPLYIASVRGHMNIVKELLLNGANTEVSLENGQTPLMAATRQGRLGIVAELLSQGADVHAADNSGATPLLIAAREGYSHVVGFLLDNGAKISETDSRGFTALHLAAQEGHFGVLQRCLSVLYNEVALDQGWLSSLGHLRSDTRGETALHLSARFGHTAIVQELLLYDEKVQHASEGLVPRTIYGPMIDLPNKFGWAALHVAVDSEQLGVISLLVQFNANVNSQDLYGNTPGHLAARIENHLVMEMLLKVPDVDIAAVNRRGKGILHYASNCIRPSTLEMLLDSGADPHAQDKEARKPLDVLNITEECNPPYVEASEIYELLEVNDTTICSGDMCPVRMGTADDFSEADSLLKIAMNTTSNHSGGQHISHPLVDGTASGPISATLVISLTPVAFLILIFAIAVAFRRKVQNCKRRRSAQQGKTPPSHPGRVCEPYVDAGAYKSNACITHLISLSSAPRDESPIDQVDRSILSGNNRMFDQVLTSLDCSSHADIPDWDSDTSSDTGTCGWSDSSLEDQASVGECSVQQPQGSAAQPNEKKIHCGKTRWT